MTPDLPEADADDPRVLIAGLVCARRGHMSLRQRVDGGRALSARAQKRRRVVRASAWATMLLIASAAVFPFLSDRLALRPLSYAIEGGYVQSSGAIEPAPASRPTLRFTDGSEVFLNEGARATLRAIDAHGARIALASGTARVDILHKPNARWLFDAGPFLITVTGTAFRFGWSETSEELDVQMDRGSVAVTGPLSDGAIMLRSGQHLVIRVRQRETFIGDVGQATGAAPAIDDSRGRTERQPTAATSADDVTLPSANAAPARRAPAPETADWPRLMATGDFGAIVRQAEQRGMESRLAEMNIADLGVLADAARYTRRDDIARRALLAERKRFPRTPQAADAAFLLGRLEETDQNTSAAVGWYDRYLGESKEGVYASEALGRKMQLVQRVGGDKPARLLAAEYLDRFPRGAYAERAKALIALP